MAGGAESGSPRSASARSASAWSKGRWIAHPDAVDGTVPNRVVFLSPFDRLIHDRARTEALWDFYYRLEMYVPKTKREYGYYVLPILRGDRLVGRIEPVHDRKAGVLRVNGVWWEPGVEPTALDAPLQAPRPLPRREAVSEHAAAPPVPDTRRAPGVWYRESFVPDTFGSLVSDTPSRRL